MSLDSNSSIVMTYLKCGEGLKYCLSRSGFFVRLGILRKFRESPQCPAQAQALNDQISFVTVTC